MALAGGFIFYLLLRARDLQMFYGDDGVLSRKLFLQQTWLPADYQVFLATGSFWGLSLFFVAGVLGGMCLFVGFKTRWASLFCWAFTVSLQLRNPMIIDGGDELLRLLFFWCPFLPLSARWSWEARKNPDWANLPENYRSVATVGVILQYALLYFFAGLLKSGDEWRKTGEALYYTLSIDQFATHLGKWMLQFPDLLRLLTPLAVGLELALGILILFPPGFLKTRLVFLGLALLFHLSIAFLMNIGIFMLIAVMGLVVFLPPAVLNRVFPTEPSSGAESFPPAYRLGRISVGFGSFMVFYILFVNIQSVWTGKKLSSWTHAVARITYEHQHWHLFAPGPFREDGWFVFEVTDQEGKVWYSLGPSDVGLKKPSHVASTFPNHRWRRWFQNLVLDPFEDTQSWRNSTAFYLAQQWLKAHPGKSIKKYRLIFMEEITPSPGSDPQVDLKVLAESVEK